MSRLFGAQLNFPDAKCRLFRFEAVSTCILIYFFIQIFAERFFFIHISPKRYGTWWTIRRESVEMRTICPLTGRWICHLFTRFTLKLTWKLTGFKSRSSIYSGKTVVMASVYGPLESRLQKELPDRLNIELIYQPKSGMPGVVERGKEKLIQTTCEQIMLTHLHPRTAVNITIQEMQDGGGVRIERTLQNTRIVYWDCCSLFRWLQLLAASINAACLALMDSGLSLQCLVAAVTCLVDSEGRIILDPGLSQFQVNIKVLGI